MSTEPLGYDDIHGLRHRAAQVMTSLGDVLQQVQILEDRLNDSDTPFTELADVMVMVQALDEAARSADQLAQEAGDLATDIDGCLLEMRDHQERLGTGGGA